MTTLTLKPKLNDEACDELAGEFIDEAHYDTVIDEDCDVLREDGTALLHYRRGVIRQTDANVAVKALYKAATEYGNRGIAAGKLKYHKGGDADKGYRGKYAVGATEDDVRTSYVKQDGTISKTNIAITVPSGIIGSFERVPRFPYCRLTKFSAESPEKVKASLPFIQTVNEVFKEVSPVRYAAQKFQCDRCVQEYIFPGTAFSTITVNKNWRTAVHKDAGDLRSGFGVLSVLSEGRYKGGLFIIPKYGVAVNLRHRDVLLADVHEWHGNSPLEGISKYWTRLSTVFYFRSKIVACKPMMDELEIAKNRTEGTPMFGDFKGDFPE